MMQLRYIPEELFRLLRVIWRIVATIIMSEIIGIITGLIIKSEHMWFFNIWYGMVYASPVGYLLGLIWLRIAEPGRITEEKIPLTVLGFFYFLLPFAAISFVLIPKYGGI